MHSGLSRRLLVFTSVAAAGLFSSAAEASLLALVLRAGTPVKATETRLRQYEVTVGYGLPWVWRWPSGPSLTTRLDVSAGTLRGGGKEGVMAAVGPTLALESSRSRLSPNFGIRVALLGDHDLGQRDLGGPIQFVSHIGIGFQLDPTLGAGYRYQHMSNGGLYHQNMGLDLQMIELTYRF